MTLNATNYSISKSLFEKIANAFKSAVRFIHRRGGYKAEYLREEEVKPLIEHTYEAFSEAVDFGVKDNVIPEAMKMYLKNNTFVFSGFKTHQQLDRVSRLLHDDDGHVKPFNRFLRDVKGIDKTYNRTYLQAEYNFAVASAQAVGKWHEFAEYADRYYLQYRTAKDERVREEHAILDGITLPFDDKFWDEFFPPNGWNCRCNVVQVSKKRYEPSNSSEALARGRSATYKPNADGVNKAAIFRFNPGKEQRIFPKKHPYFPKGCGDCGLNQYAVGKGNAMCFACEALNVIRGDITGYDLENVGKNKIFISRQQDAAEKETNLVIAKYLASRHKNDIILLPNIPNEKGLKNVDSFNVTKNRFEEYKFCTSSKPNTIDVEVKEASKQSSYAIIYLKTKPDSMKRLKKLLQRRVNRHDGLNEVFVIFGKKNTFFRKTNRKPK